MKRTILVILSNRLTPAQKTRFFEIECNEKGDILEEHPLRKEPRDAQYDEVWENDEGKSSISSCHRFKRKYRHALEKPKSKVKK